MDTFTTDDPRGPGGLTLRLTVRAARNDLVVAGELDLGSADRLRRVLARLEQAHRPLDLDLSGVEFVDCAGWRVVRDAVQRGGSGTAVHIVAMSPQVRRLSTLLADLEHRSAAPTASDVQHG